MDIKQTTRNEQERKAYASPELVAYGSIEELTKTLAQNPTDGLGGTSPGTILPDGYAP
jgi:hypothetical protein